ncbi:hypothetical protein [Pyxidicoccus caerfyrddinensis]|uniref:hypothetical protein n=1 Tax=Pyxidicoccus caerfyrddinensis TaxID=2709663 RepID=UPI0013DA1CCA|nr:hypothetical protein [Pyxidicoccus caerfyrddinensis]
MLEILAIVALCKKLAAIAKEKGRSAGWAALGALFWFMGEVVGEIMGLGLGGYLVAIAFACIGAFVAHTIVKALPEAPVAVTPSL